MEYLEDYDFTLHYHPGKANVVVDALGQKSRGVLANVNSREWQMLEPVALFGLYYNEQTQGILGSLVATLSLLSKVIESQGEDTEILSIRDRVQLGTSDEGWATHTNGSLRYRGPVVVPQLVELRDEILRELHCSRFCSASRRHEDVQRSTSPVLMKRNEEARWRLCTEMSHVSACQG